MILLVVVAAGWMLGTALQTPHQRTTSVGRHSAPLRRAVATAPSRPTEHPVAIVSVARGPSLDARLVDEILAAYGSPLRGHGKEIVALSREYHVDDAVALAFFAMESRMGTQGEATITHSFGNLRPMPNEPSLDGYRTYDTWVDGAREWFHVIRTLYLDQMHRASVGAIVPVYAPQSDNNNPATMIAGIYQLVACWRGSPTSCPDEPAAIRALIAARHA